MLITLLVAVTVVFVALTVLPGDPVRGLFGPKRPPQELYDAIVQQYHFDEPLLRQYVLYVRDVVTGNWGNGLPVDPWGDASPGPAVRDVVRAAVPVSARLLAGALVIQALVGLTAGAIASARPGKVSSSVYVWALVLVSIPVLVVAYVSRRIFAIELGWLPPSGAAGGWTSYVLPTLSLAALSTGYVALLVRSSLTDTLRAPWVAAAHARGLRSSRIVRHAIRPALIPVVTFLAASVGQLVNGLIIVEGVFGMPGLGGQVVRALQQHDRAMLVGLVTVIIAAVIVASTVADLLYGIIDPRIGRSEGLGARAA